MRTCDEVIECFLVSGQSDYVRKRSVHTALTVAGPLWMVVRETVYCEPAR